MLNICQKDIVGVVLIEGYFLILKMDQTVKYMNSVSPLRDAVSF